MLKHVSYMNFSHFKLDTIYSHICLPCLLYVSAGSAPGCSSGRHAGTGSGGRADWLPPPVQHTQAPTRTVSTWHCWCQSVPATSGVLHVSPLHCFGFCSLNVIVRLTCYRDKAVFTCVRTRHPSSAHINRVQKLKNTL